MGRVGHVPSESGPKSVDSGESEESDGIAKSDKTEKGAKVAILLDSGFSGMPTQAKECPHFYTRMTTFVTFIDFHAESSTREECPLSRFLPAGRGLGLPGPGSRNHQKVTESPESRK